MNIKTGEEFNVAFSRGTGIKSCVDWTLWRGIDYSTDYWYNAYTPQ
jgi:hypothetical protein